MRRFFSESSCHTLGHWRMGATYWEAMFDGLPSMFWLTLGFATFGLGLCFRATSAIESSGLTLVGEEFFETEVHLSQGPICKESVWEPIH